MNKTRFLPNKNISLNSVFCLLLALTPILNGYSSGIGSFSLGMLVFSVIVAFVTVNVLLIKKKNNDVFCSLLPIALAAIFIFSSFASYLTIDYYNIPDSNVVVFAWIKRMIWGVSIVTLPAFINYKKICKTLKAIAVISTIYLVLQNLFFYFLKIQLPNIFEIGFIKPNYDYYSISGSASLIGTSRYRPGSFFAEPAFYGYFVNLVLTTIIFDQNVKKANIVISLFLSLGIILSTSSGGIYILFLIWILFFLKNLRKNLHSAKFVILFALVVLISLLFVALINNMQALLNLGNFGKALYQAFNKFASWDINSRLGGSYEKLSFLSKSNLVFGVGIGCNDYYLSAFSSEGYVNSLVELILQNGIFGLVLFLLFVLMLFLKNKDFIIRTILIIYLIDGLYSGIYFSLFGMLYLIVVYTRRRYINGFKTKDCIQ